MDSEIEQTFTEDPILIPVSYGELIDKLTILEIKSECMRDINKLNNVNRELELLSEIFN